MPPSTATAQTVHTPAFDPHDLQPTVRIRGCTLPKTRGISKHAGSDETERLGPRATPRPNEASAQRNNVLDNYEALALGPRLEDGRYILFVTSDDNDDATRVARTLVLALRIPGDAQRVGHSIPGRQRTRREPQDLATNWSSSCSF